MISFAAAAIAVIAVEVGTEGRAAEPAEPQFAQVGVAFLHKHCLQCHSGEQPKADVLLQGVRDDATIINQRKLLEHVLEMVESGAMPPEKRPRPSADELASFVKSVRAVFERADRNVKPDPGRVTMRRLNRVEYRNTVRDLIGVDFDPTEDFPSDDIGHGFDNIGDVLTLSPVLMERYMAAAESIVQRAITPNPPPSPKRHLSTRYSEPASANVPMEGSFRVLATDGKSPVETGPINTPYQWEEDGQYIFRARVFAKSSGGSPLQVAFLVTGANLPQPASDDEAAKLSGSVIRPMRILKTFEIKADKPESAEVLEVTVPAMPGRHRMAVAIVKPAEGQAPAKLYVEYLALEGPLDTRPASHRRLLACSPGKPKNEQTREVLTRFLQHAYRRPSTSEELDRLVALVESTESSGATWEAAVQLAIQAVLCSPKFLFRVELDDRPTSPDARPLDEYQLASRLSYFLWSTMPDDELLALAAKKQLTANLESQVRRMLQDPKSQSLVQNFALQWLQLKRLETFSPDAKLFPQFNEPLRAAMRKETELFFDSIVRQDRSILDLIDADYTFLNEPLARHYGITDTNGTLAGQKPAMPGGQPIRGDRFVQVNLSGGQRGGLLTQASVLTVTSNPTRTSPVKRGRWVLEQILGTPPPPPPPNVPELVESEQAALTGSLRQRMEQHRSNPSCANCHARMDPIGFAFENYDAIGRFRTKDGEFPIDPAGQLPDGRSFQGPEELKTILKEKQDLFSRCLTEKLLTYALGRGLENYDKPAVDRITLALANNDYKFSTLVVEIAKSDPFRLRRGAAETKK